MNPRLILRKSFTVLKLLFEWLAHHAYKSEYEKNRDKWYADGCDDKLRYEFPELSEKSIVIDLGGWKGEWAGNIYSRFRCKVHIFEAVPSFAKNIQERFAFNSDISVYPFGLGAQNTSLEVFIGQEGSSIFYNRNTSQVRETCDIVSVEDFLNENKFEQIDLVKINIEGGEYDLLEKIIELDFTSSINCYLVQFHDFVPGFDKRRKAIRNKLSETHDLQFDYPFVWECWKLK